MKRGRLITYVLLTLAVLVIGAKIYLKEFSPVDDKILGRESHLLFRHSGRNEPVSWREVERKVEQKLGFSLGLPEGFVCTGVWEEKIRGRKVIFLMLEGRGRKTVVGLAKTGRRRGFMEGASHLFGEREGFSFFVFDGKNGVRVYVMSPAPLEEVTQWSRENFLLTGGENTNEGGGQ
ncbi:MAG: hypothetical protein D6713_07345 [Deltaproteobacteria bacterium]|nr:MAG: hypothetical protein D6713_07345 [Deltaproteobacteria bacterium]